MLMINWTQELQGKSPQGAMDIFQQQSYYCYPNLSAQHGFKARHSTVTNLLEALNVWAEALMH